MAVNTDTQPIQDLIVGKITLIKNLSIAEVIAIGEVAHETHSDPPSVFRLIIHARGGVTDLEAAFMVTFSPLIPWSKIARAILDKFTEGTIAHRLLSTEGVER